MKLKLSSLKSFYFYSDGIVDQFDEEGKKKFSSKRLNNLIEESSDQSFSELKQIFKQEINDWKGKGEQTDDCVLFAFEVE